MVIRESNNGSDYVVCISTSAKKGDRSGMFGRNDNHAEVPLVICYNMGVDFDLRTDAEKRARVLSMLKMLRVGINEVMTDIGGLVGGKGPQVQPHEIGRRKRNYQMGGREIVSSANIPCHSIESFWRVVKLGRKGGRPPCPGGLPGSGVHS
jgi:hypothetical protein